MPSLPNDAPQWLVLAVAIIAGGSFLLKFLSETSDTVAKILGPLGRYLRRRGDERRREREAAAPGKDRAFADMERENARFYSWYEQDQRFHREVAIKSAELGCDLPPWVPLSQWPPERPADAHEAVQPRP